MSDVQATVAKHPFDHQNADIILRSSDNVDFHVFKIILSLASPIFNDMFSIPQPAELDDHRCDIPVVNVEEDAETLDGMLRYCYPGCDPKIITIDSTIKVLRAGRKYELDCALERIGDTYVRIGEIDKKPVRAFALACRYRLGDLARVAAKAALNYPVDELFQQEQEVDLETVSARDYHQLYQYHYTCRIACQKLTKDCGWVRSLGRLVFMSCSEVPGHHDFAVSPRTKWWLGYMQRIGTAFMQEGPSAVKVSDFERAVRDAEATKCSNCQRNALGDMMKFSEQFAAKIASTISSVPLNIDF